MFAKAINGCKEVLESCANQKVGELVVHAEE